ncbi:cytochrome c maturation protein CcmE [Rickettsiella endosymbiont of Xylota segnis]|uniref:cytochrome c maturation protein CcmE n=1 Tax=Rickettsiella endosymbiont of Xylota segnis TaxID=3066238 RepID=UPI0030D02532
MNALQKKRLNFVLLMLLVAGFVIGLSLYALKQNINLFYTPTQLAEQHLTPGRPFRLGGQVKKGTVKQNEQHLLVSFVVSDASHNILVEYQGVLPDLFREGQSVVIEGSLDQAGIMQAKQVLAKHDERYRAVK